MMFVDRSQFYYFVSFRYIHPKYFQSCDYTEEDFAVERYMLYIF